MPDEIIDTLAASLNNINGTLPETQEADQSPPQGDPSPNINKRLPRGERLPDYGIEYFNQLVAQYLTLPPTEMNARNANAVAVANALIKEQTTKDQEKRPRFWEWDREQENHHLNWGDVSGMEMALLQLLPDAYLERFAWNLRARYHEVAGQTWYDYYQQSKPPAETPAPDEANTATASVKNTSPSAFSRLLLLTPFAPAAPAHSTDNGAATKLRADLSVLLNDLQRLRSTIQAREEKRGHISKKAAQWAFLSLVLALTVFAGTCILSSKYPRSAVLGPTAIAAAQSAAIAAAQQVPAAVPTPNQQAPVKPVPLSLPKTTGGTHKAAPGVKPTATTVAPPKPQSAEVTKTPSLPAPLHLSSVLDILQISVLVILCGVMGGLISMLRRLQALPTGSTPLIDTVALNAGQFGISLAPVYGGIFAMVLYIVFLSGLLSSIIAPAVQTTVFPTFSDATPATTADFAKLLVWAFIAGFAEKLVPDVLDRITAKNTAPSPVKPMAASSPVKPTTPS